MVEAPAFRGLAHGAERADAWARLTEPWELLIIGGGITGASLLAAAVRQGVRALLVEAEDFASGTSSHSGQLVHGGMRYLRQGRWGMTRRLLRERDRLLRAHAGLIDPLPFVLPTYRTRPADHVAYALAVRLYDLLRGHPRSWQRVGREAVQARIPGVRGDGLDGGFLYHDAVTDDARLVLWQLRDAVRGGGLALNYARVTALVRERGQVAGAEVVDTRSGAGITVRSRVVVNATGAHADTLREGTDATRRLRAIRGSHLVIPRRAFPVRCAMGYRHPASGRYQYLVPWDDVVVVGTTDIEGGPPDAHPPRASAHEITHLLEGLHHVVPDAGIGPANLTAAYAGVRPVADLATGDPSRAARDSVLWDEGGVLTVVSGKLTGFQAIVHDAMRHVAMRLPSRQAASVPSLARQEMDRPAPNAPSPVPTHVPTAIWQRLLGRHGLDAAALVEVARPGELEFIPDTRTLWAELRWGARAEQVEHLDDLLLRRTRIGLQLPDGAASTYARLEAICREELRWDADRWASERDRFQGLWARRYAATG